MFDHAPISSGSVPPPAAPAAPSVWKGKEEMKEAPVKLDRASAVRTIGATWDDHHWRHDAECRDTDTSIFFPEGDDADTQEATAHALRLCAACPVRDACLEFALRTRQLDGIWGGLNEEQRRSLRRRRQAAARRTAAATTDRKSA